MSTLRIGLHFVASVPAQDTTTGTFLISNHSCEQQQAAAETYFNRLAHNCRHCRKPASQNSTTHTKNRPRIPNDVPHSRCRSSVSDVRQHSHSPKPTIITPSQNRSLSRPPPRSPRTSSQTSKPNRSHLRSRSPTLTINPP